MDSSDEEAFLTCKVCDLPFTGIKPFEQHLKGKKHKKQMKRKMGKKSLGGGGDALGLEDTEDEDGECYKCDICETTCTGIISYKQHLRSRPHAKALRRKRAEEDPTKYDDATSISELPDDDADLNDLIKELIPESFASCSICDKEFTGPESYYQHLKSKSHSKRKSQLRIILKIKAELKKYKELSEAKESGDFTREVQHGEKGLALSEEHAELECQECHKSFSGAVSLAQHLVSKVHTKRQYRNKLLEELKDLSTLELEDGSTSEDAESGEGQDDDSTLDSVLTCDICSLAFSGPESAKAHFRSKGHQKTLRWRKYLGQNKKVAKQSSHTQADIAVKDDEITVDHDKMKSEMVEEKSDDKSTVKEIDSGTGGTHVLTQENSASESASDDYDDDNEKCPSYHEVEKQVPSENVDQKNPDDYISPGADKNSESLYPILPIEDDQKALENTEKEEHETSDSEGTEREDGPSLNRSNGDEISSCDNLSGEKKKKKILCKSGVRKIVRSVIKVLD